MEEEPKVPEYTIQQISRMFQIPSSTLRYYEESGILPDIQRNASGHRVFTDWHIQRIKAICCFKNTGMTIAQLKDFFSYENAEPENIDEILLLLEERKATVKDQIQKLQNDYIHVLRKLCYYGDMKKCLQNGQPLPKWEDYEGKEFAAEDS